MKLRLFSLCLSVLLFMPLAACVGPEAEDTAVSGTALTQAEPMAAMESISQELPVYYAENGELLMERQLLECSPQALFEAWREKNDLPETAGLLDCRVDNNGTETTEDFEGSEVYVYTAGDHDDIYLILSAGLEEPLRDELLRESLERSFLVMWYLAPSYEELLEATSRPWEFHYTYTNNNYFEEAPQ